MVTRSSLLLLLLVGIAYGAPAEDFIVDLPGLVFETNYNQYSGYLQASEDRFYHYWFVESQNNPVTDPVVLWLNGGPGCSSLLGFFTELGPFYIDQDGEGILRENPYSWNKNASVIFLESPACVGFSYDVNGNCTSSDDSTSLDNYNALQDFFFNKFPEYLGNEFYITGESYAGMYIPTLTERIVDGLEDVPLNFQGFAIGNGYFDVVTNTDSEMFFSYYHSVIGDELWTSLTEACCEDGVANRESCTFGNSTDVQCIAFVNEVIIRMFDTGLNPYNLYSTCESSSENQQLQFDIERIFEQRNINFHRPSPTAALDDTYDPACSNNAIEIAYLNDEEVRAQIHIPLTVQQWEPCSRISYHQQHPYVVDKIAYVANATRGLIYNGDVDMVCNVIGNEWSIEDLQLPVIEDRRTWLSDGQVAGFVKRFETLDFLTFKGCGHMVPGYEPKAALHVLNAFLNKEPY